MVVVVVVVVSVALVLDAVLVLLVLGRNLVVGGSELWLCFCILINAGCAGDGGGSGGGDNCGFTAISSRAGYFRCRLHTNIYTKVIVQLSAVISCVVSVKAMATNAIRHVQRTCNRLHLGTLSSWV